VGKGRTVGVGPLWTFLGAGLGGAVAIIDEDESLDAVDFGEVLEFDIVPLGMLMVGGRALASSFLST
jgi:hypothetical protein